MKTVITNDAILVLLPDAFVHQADEVGKARHLLQGSHNYRGLEVCEATSGSIWRLGAFGEAAVSYALDIPWDGRITNDVGGYEVKTVEDEYRRLFIPTRGRHREPDTVYISVRHAGNSQQNKKLWLLRGWMRAGEIMKPENLSTLGNEDRQLVWVVENNMLHPMSTLPHVEPRK